MSMMSTSSSCKAVSFYAVVVVLCLVVAGGNAVAAFDYADALDKVLLFFEAQRSGKLPPDQRVRWRGDSGLSDGSAAQMDLLGGYYDAGDNVKFGLPTAFTVTMQSWSVVVEFGGATPRHLEYVRAAVRWGADYLLKAATAAPDAVYVQVGDPYQEHRCWERPEDMDTPRSVYRVTPQSPGSDVAGETAAALAAASHVFRTCDPAYSSRLLRAAQKAFDFADRYRGSYSDSLSSVACPFYCSYSGGGYQDKLLSVAAWLHLATQTQGEKSKNGTGMAPDVYLSYIRLNGHVLGAEQEDFTFSWDDKRAGTKVPLSKAYFLLLRQLQGNNDKARSMSDETDATLQLYKAHADIYVCSLLPGQSLSEQQQQYTPGGLLFKSGDSNMLYVTSTAFLLLTYANSLASTGGGASVSCGSAAAVPPSALVAVAKKHVDYILGANPTGTSYMVGFGAQFPRHRGASLPSVHDHPTRIGCDQGFGYLHSPDPDRNMLVGAVVGGPDGGDHRQPRQLRAG